MKLYDYQEEALKKMKNGSILCGGVGLGKSIVALAYYILVSGGNYERPRGIKNELVIITTAKKRDSKEWDIECQKFCIENYIVDSWNNIKKYRKKYGVFFIFDEQRVVGNGLWVKSFLDITRKNKWILLSATPGDTWSDYIPVFIANGFYRNKTEFSRRHCVYARFSKYPKIERYVETGELEYYRSKILIPMKDLETNEKLKFLVKVDYDRELYKEVWRERWDPWTNEPIDESGKLFYLIRRVVNSDPSRVEECKKIIEKKKKVIIFYNFTYELELLRKMCEEEKYVYSEWNGKVHQELPQGENWIYLAQYTAACEGWNCVTTDTIIFYSQSYSYRQTEQAMGRIDRGRSNIYKTLYYYILRSNSSIDIAIYKALSVKKNFNERGFKWKL